MKYQRWLIPRPVLSQTERAFKHGRHEVFVLWTAALAPAGPDACIERCVVPQQRPGNTPQGVYVHIAGDELQRIQLHNFSVAQRSIVQLHTHPSADVNMSALDREWEVARHLGALSIIVPSYGDRGVDGFAGVNVYEREDADWRLWRREELLRRLVIV